MLFVGCGDDSGGSDRTGGAGGSKAGSAGATSGGATSGGTGGASGGTGGSSGGTGGASGGTGGMALVCTGTATEGVITDVNGTTSAFTGGGYYIYADQSETTGGGTTVPTTDPAAGTPTITPVTGGHEGSALHFSGTGFQAASWGAGVGIWTDCADASGVSGVTFWYKSDQTLRVSITIPETSNPAYSPTGECTMGDACKANGVEVEPSAADTWTEATVLFDDLAGGSAPFSSARVQGIDFLIVPPAGGTEEWDFDVWIDDVSWGAGDGTGAGGTGAGGDTSTAGAGGA